MLELARDLQYHGQIEFYAVRDSVTLAIMDASSQQHKGGGLWRPS